MTYATDLNYTDCHPVVLDTPFRKCSGLYVGAAGNVNVRFAGSGKTQLFSGVPAGTILPLHLDMVLTSTTTASLFVALY
jgi:hypothetical protein